MRPKPYDSTCQLRRFRQFESYPLTTLARCLDILTGWDVLNIYTVHDVSPTHITHAGRRVHQGFDMHQLRPMNHSGTWSESLATLLYMYPLRLSSSFRRCNHGPIRYYFDTGECPREDGIQRRLRHHHAWSSRNTDRLHSPRSIA